MYNFKIYFSLIQLISFDNNSSKLFKLVEIFTQLEWSKELCNENCYQYQFYQFVIVYKFHIKQTTPSKIVTLLRSRPVNSILSYV